jgi:transcriptional regulator with XRE-family HTH domain
MLLKSETHKRQRGVTLTPLGRRKLHKAKAEKEIENNIPRYTLAALSEATGLTPTTLSKIFSGSSAVDKQTLAICFEAFHLDLSTADYLYRSPDRDDLTEIDWVPPAENLSFLELTGDVPRETLCNRSIPLQNHKINQFTDYPQPLSQKAPGGQIPLDSVYYIDRPVLESLCYESIQQPGTLVNICAPKQMGKSSLMTRILVHASFLGYHTVSVDLQLADAEILLNLGRFLKWFCARVSKQLGLPNAIADCWDMSLGNKSNATDYFEDILLASIALPLVIAIDELNQLFAYPDIAGEFLLLLRTWSERAKVGNSSSNPWHKLRLVTVYSSEMLMSEAIAPSLLNTGLVIELPEFTLAQVQDLANRYEQEITELEIEQLITLLGGHPYRLQLAFYYFQQQAIIPKELLENTEIALAIYAEHLHQQWWNLQRYPNLWTVFTQIVKQPSPVTCEAEQGSQLQKMGLVQLTGFQANLACELFRPFFYKRLPQISG